MHQTLYCYPLWMNSNVVLSRAFALLIVFSIVAVRFTDCCIQLRFAQEIERFVVNLLMTLLVCVPVGTMIITKKTKSHFSFAWLFVISSFWNWTQVIGVFLLRLYQMCGRTNKNNIMSNDNDSGTLHIFHFSSIC